MANAETTALRGFDSYAVSLGDELRGERASLGKSLLDVQRDLRIKAAHIDAIENANPDGIPYHGYVSGYVRAYARYLGLDEEATFARFCAESGFAPQSRISVGATSGRRRLSAAARSDIDAVIAGSRLAAVSRTETFNGELDATLRGLGSLTVLLLVVSGLAYGGWTLLENIQRVDFSPLPQAPTALASAPAFDIGPTVASAGFASIPAPDRGAIAAVYAAQEVSPPQVALRDGPISTIDPRHAGVYSNDRRPAALRRSEAVEAFEGTGAVAGEVVASAPAIPHAPALALRQSAIADDRAEAAPEPDMEPAPVRVVLVIATEAWLRVRDEAGSTVHEALMQPGARWEAPAGATGLTLRAGNAAGVYVEIGDTLYGPLGSPGEVVSGVSLDPEAVRRTLTALERDPLTTSSLENGSLRPQ
jgi:cytoskeletal protein RodZ